MVVSGVEIGGNSCGEVKENKNEQTNKAVNANTQHFVPAFFDFVSPRQETNFLQVSNFNVFFLTRARRLNALV